MHRQLQQRGLALVQSENVSVPDSPVAPVLIEWLQPSIRAASLSESATAVVNFSDEIGYRLPILSTSSFIIRSKIDISGYFERYADTPLRDHLACHSAPACIRLAG